MVAPGGVAIAVKLNSDGRNSTSPYRCYVGKNYDAHPSLPLEGKVSRRSRDESATSLRDVGEILPTAKYSRAARTEGAGGCAKANFADIASQEKLSPRAKEQSFSVKPFFKKACGVSGRSPEQSPDVHSDRGAFAHQINKQRSKR